MVRLYTWLPATPDVLLEREIAPDLGHCSLEIVDSDGRATLYASYWPELSSVAGKLTDILKHRQSRQPGSYQKEIAPEEHYMQRPPDFLDVVDGLDERRIALLWPKLRNSRYHFQKWNCSSVAKQLLLAGMDKRDRKRADRASNCGDNASLSLPQGGNLIDRLRSLAASRVVACSPEGVRNMVLDYNSTHRVAVEKRSSEPELSRV